MTRVIGLISGTSVDGIDAALVDITGTELDLKVEVLKGETYPYPEQLSQQIMAVCGGAAIAMAELAQLDDAIAYSFAQAALNIQKDLPSAELIGSHGQNIYHRPVSKMDEHQKQASPHLTPVAPLGDTPRSHWLPISRQLLHLGTPQDRTGSPSPSLGYTLQIGRGDLIARLTGIPTMSNFRVADVAAGGQGAPLVPKVDAYLLSHPEKSRCVQNLGGIGNLAYLPARSRPHWLEEIRGWDTGPANTLIDLAVQHFTDGAQTYDSSGEWAASGTPCYDLVEQWLRQDFFHQLPPKSTGRELFGSQYLDRCLLDAQAYQLSPADMLATLSELTVASIVHSYRTFLPQQPDQVLLCGGGSKNIYLKERLQAQLKPTVVLTTDEVGLSADFKEAIAFAVLAYWRNLGILGNLPQVTGARQQVLLGDIHPVYFAPIR